MVRLKAMFEKTLAKQDQRRLSLNELVLELLADVAMCSTRGRKRRDPAVAKGEQDPEVENHRRRRKRQAAQNEKVGITAPETTQAFAEKVAAMDRARIEIAGRARNEMLNDLVFRKVGNPT